MCQVLYFQNKINSKFEREDSLVVCQYMYNVLSFKSENSILNKIQSSNENIAMGEINKAVESESVSSYLTCCSNEDTVQISNGDRTKTFTDTKSRLYNRYDDDHMTEDNVRKLYSQRSQSPESSTTTLCALQREKIVEQKGKPSEKSSSLPYANQATYNQPFDVDRFRRSSNREITATIVKKSRTEQKSFTELPTFYKSSHSKKGLSQNLDRFIRTW